MCDARESSMKSWFDQYQKVVRAQPRLDDSWFIDALAFSRSGNEIAMRRIKGSCLETVLDIVMSKWNNQLGIDILELLQDANYALDNVLAAFPGSTAGEFVQF